MGDNRVQGWAQVLVLTLLKEEDTGLLLKSQGQTLRTSGSFSWDSAHFRPQIQMTKLLVLA